MLPLRQIFNNNKILIRNFSSLSVLQFSNYLFPLITFPYLVRVLGPEKFGLVNFAAAFVTYFTIFTDYGFNLTATQEISVNRKNQDKINKIFSSVFVIKTVLFLIGLLVFLSLVFGIPKFYVDAPVYIFSFLAVFGSLLSPVWFFQGMEEMNYITVISVTVKAIWVIAVFLLIKNPADILILVILNGTSFVLIGIAGLIVVKIRYGVKFRKPSLTELKRQLTEGWYVFMSTASITLYTTTNTFILGLFAGNEIVGYFSAADKIKNAVQGLFNNAAQTVFPYLSKLFSESKIKAFKFVKNYMRLTVSVAIVLTLFMFIFSEDIVLLVLGNNYIPSITVFRIILFLPLVILLSNIYGIQLMLNLGFKKEFSRIIFLSGVFSVAVSLILVPVFYEIGTAITVLLTEILVTSQMYFFLKKKGIKI